MYIISSRYCKHIIPLTLVPTQRVGTREEYCCLNFKDNDKVLKRGAAFSAVPRFFVKDAEKMGSVPLFSRSWFF
jgi:hypothetical protein